MSVSASLITESHRNAPSRIRWAGSPLQWQQKQAAAAAMLKFETDDRIQVIMACGSGKTMVAANVAVERQLGVDRWPPQTALPLATQTAPGRTG